MVGHHAPCPQIVSLPIEMKERLFHQSRYTFPPQVTRTMAPIQICLQPGSLFPVIFDVEQVSPFRDARLR